MGSSNPSIDFRELLDHAEWIRGVARRLVDCPGVAEDVVQDTWVEALERPPRFRSNLRGWLGRVAANRARHVGRGETRRRRRERAVARPERAPALDEIAERASLQREVVGHVLALDEPFRSVVLLRFFEGQAPPEIAAHLGVPLKTVHSRLARAFDKLRARLDAEYGDRRSWSLAIAPLLASRRAAPALAGTSSLSTLGIWIMNTKVGVAVAMALVGGVAWWGTTLGTAEAVELEPDRPVPMTDVSVASPPDRSERAEPAVRSDAVSDVTVVPAPGGTETEAQEPVPSKVRGRAVSIDGAPLVGRTIAFEHALDEPLGKTGPDGQFEALLPGNLGPSRFHSPSGGLCLRVVDDAWVTVRQSCVDATNRDAHHLVVAAPVTSLAGRVEDQDGAPVPQARISVRTRSQTFLGFPHALDLTSAIALTTESDDSGLFTFERFPEAPRLSLHAVAEGYITDSVALDDAAWPLVVRLVKASESDRVILEGTVVDERGFPVEGARVRLSDATADTNEAGLFRLALPPLMPTTPLCAAKPGHLPAVIADFGAIVEAQGGEPGAVELVLGGPPLEIRGRVIDADGNPCAGWSVSTIDALPITPYQIPFDTAEGFARGGEQVATTDGDGRFELDGLFAREYRVQAFDPGTLRRTEAVLTAGDRDAILRASGSMLASVEGIVRSRRGTPLANVRVQVCLDTVTAPWGSSMTSSAEVITDESGEFVFERVPAEFVYLRYTGDEILPGRRDLERDPGARHEIVVLQRCHFRVELSNPGPSDAPHVVEFFDEDGERLQINRFEARGMSAFMSLRLTGSESDVLSVSEAATQVILREGDSELSRQEVRLDPGSVTVLRL